MSENLLDKLLDKLFALNFIVYNLLEIIISEENASNHIGYSCQISYFELDFFFKIKSDMSILEIKCIYKDESILDTNEWIKKKKNMINTTILQNYY